MRIGLDFRFLAFGHQGLVRGIPRFSQEQLQSVLELDADNTYLLLCEAGVDVESIRSEIRHAPNTRVVCAPEELKSVADNDDEPTTLEQFSAYQRWLEGLRLDLFHATCPAWLKGRLMPGFDVCPYVATAYDLIPLLYPAHYLPVPAQRESYEQRLVFLEQATRIAAISHAVARDLVEHLGVPPQRIDVTPPAPSSCFRPLPSDVARGLLKSLDHPTRLPPRQRVQIPADYLLCISDLHYSKNLTTLLPAYAELRRATRKRFPLVVAGHLSPAEVDHLQRLARYYDIAGDVIIAGRVSDEELTALYNCAMLTVHPSHHEGFGLPVVEAMRCGSPVITTTRSALPETAGDAALLVDSDDAVAFTEAIELLLNDGERRDDMRRRGIEQAKRYTPAHLGRATLQCYERATSSQARAAEGTTRVAIWSPIPPQDTAISYYTGDLVPALATDRELELDVFVDDDVLPPLELLRAARVRHWSDFERTAERRPFDVVMYQLGASPSQAYMEQAMLSHPGVVVLHDLRWSHALCADRLARADGERRFHSEVDAMEGEQAGREWDRLRALPSRRRADGMRRFLDEHPMLGRVVDAARCLVSVTPSAGLELLRRYPHAHLANVIPLGVRDPLRDGVGADRDAARAYLGVDRDAFMVLVPTADAAIEYIEAALLAFADLKRAGMVDAFLAVVGTLPNGVSEAQLRAEAVALGVGDAVRVSGRVARAAYDAYMGACDALVVLGDPGVGVIPDAAVRAFAVGRCVLISDTPASRLLPDSTCVRVAATALDHATVTQALLGIADDPARRDSLERCARAHYEQTARLEPMVEGYRSLIREQAARQPSDRAPAAPRAAITVPTGRPGPRTGPLAYSKVCELEDFEHPELRPVIRDVCAHKRSVFGAGFPTGYEYRKDWEVAMAVRTLADHGALRPDARLLGVAAGTEDTVFYLTRHVGEVVAIDRYLEPAEWEETAPTTMVVNPAQVAPFAFKHERLRVQHMDARILDYPDESFDGIFSSGSIEHFGDLQTIAAAAYEMGRVLKPGGVLTLSTELLLSRDAGGRSVQYPGLMLFSPGELVRYIVDASGLEAIDDLDLSVSHWTLGTSRDMATAVRTRHERQAAQARGARVPAWACWDMPHIVIELDGKRFTSVHLALRRAPVHPVVDNSWAQPTPALRADVARSTVVPLDGAGAAGHEMSSNGSVSAAALLDAVQALASKHDAAKRRITALLRDVGDGSAKVGASLEEAAKPEPGVYVAWYPKPERPASPRETVSISPLVGNAIRCPIASTLTPPYTVLVAEDADDIISGEFLAGRGAALNTNLISLVLALAPPGGTFLDIGANIGSISLPVAAAGRRVLSVEAAPVNAELLEASARLNGLGGRVRVLSAAIGDHDGEASFVPHGCHGQLVEGDIGRSTRVPLRTIDSLVEAERLERLDFVKIDVEGAEVDVLRGMPHLAERTAAPYLLVECCPHTLSSYGHTTAELVALLEEYGYAVYNVDTARLVRRRADEVQVTTVVDVLAAKQGLQLLPGWRIEPPMSREELVARFVYEGRLWNADCRASAARVARELHPDVLALPDVVNALNWLAKDPEPMVRAAAAWWHEAHAVVGARQ